MASREPCSINPSAEHRFDSGSPGTSDVEEPCGDGDRTLEQKRHLIKDNLCVVNGPRIDRENEQQRQLQEMNETSSFMRAFRIITAVLMFCAIMISALASKTAFFVIIFRFRNSMNATGLARPLTNLDIPREAGITFAALFIVLLVPHTFVLLWSFWSGFLGRKTENYPWPTTRAKLWAVLAGVLESLGMVLFVFEVCVDLPTPLAIALCSGVLVFPLLCPFESFSLSYTGYPSRGSRTLSGKSDAAPAFRQSPLRRLTWLVCIPMQIGILIAIPIALAKNLNEEILRGHNVWRLACVPLSVVCLSVSWSGFVQHRMNDCQRACTISPYRTARWKSAMISSFAKLVSTVAFYFTFDQVFGYNSVKHMKLGFQLLDGDYDMTVAILVHVICGLLSYVLICAACAMTLHRWSMVLPLLTTTPLCIILATAACSSDDFTLEQIGNGIWGGYSFCSDHRVVSDNIAAFILLCLLWLPQVAYAFIFVTRISVVPLSKEEAMFHAPGYNPVFIDQYTFVNWKVDHLTPPPFRQREHDVGISSHSHAASQGGSGKTPRKKRKVYICSTMYREADYEQENLLKSIRHVHKAIQDKITEADHLEFESHVFFDGAVRNKTYNDFVLQLFSLVETTLGFDVNDVDMLETPYGMQANWNMPRRHGDGDDTDSAQQSGIRFTVHLKDGHKFKNKKRWSQVMYMSYVIDYCCRRDKGRRGDFPDAAEGNYDNGDVDDQIADTFILTTDADIVFSYSSVKALLDLMARDDGVGAVCARTHPTGSGPLVWYQVFDYAIGHWFQKTAEHVIGSVMCCPGCFSVFRCRALQDVLHIYATKVEQATEFLTKDMGEDRWLCTLLVEKGWQLVYCAASENHTFCPESFEEFYKQRRRWIPSTLANLGLCVEHSARIVQNNDSVGWWFILYQALMIISTLISPGTIILLISSGLAYAYGWNSIATLVLVSIVTVGFGIICVSYKKYEMMAAKFLTFVFAVLMVAVFVGVLRQIVLDAGSENCLEACEPLDNMTYIPEPGCERGYHKVMYNCTHASFLGAPVGVTTIYLGSLASMFLLAGLSHPSEFFCLIHGVWYLLCLPSGYILLFVYSLCNMDSQSWGTREAKTSSGGSGGSGSWQEFIQRKIQWLRETFCEAPPSAKDFTASRPESPASAPETAGQQQSSSATSPPEPVPLPQNETGSVTEAAGVADSGRQSTSGDRVSQESTAGAGAGTTLPVAAVSSASVGISERSVGEATGAGHSQSHCYSEHEFSSVASGGVGDGDGGGDGDGDGAALPSSQRGQESGDDSILPCYLVDRTDIRTFLRKHQLEHLTARFVDNGYEDAMFLVGMPTSEMADLGVDLSVRRGHLNRDIKALPQVPFEHGVPDSIDSWLRKIGLPVYSKNFRSRGYITNGGDDNIVGIKELTKKKLIEEIGIRKKGHLTHILKAIEFIRYPTDRELRIKSVRNKISGRSDPTLAREEENREELLFWEALREACMKPEMAALGTNKELAEKLVELRNTSIMTVAIANILWIVIIQTLASHPELNIAGTNPIGLMFLLVYGLVYITQFISMLVHRLITVMHMLAAAKETLGQHDSMVIVDMPKSVTIEDGLGPRGFSEGNSPTGYQLLGSEEDTVPLQPISSNYPYQAASNSYQHQASAAERTTGKAKR